MGHGTRQYILRPEMRDLRHGELTPETIDHLIPIPTRNNLRRVVVRKVTSGS